MKIRNPTEINVTRWKPKLARTEPSYQCGTILGDLDHPIYGYLREKNYCPVTTKTFGEDKQANPNTLILLCSSSSKFKAVTCSLLNTPHVKVANFKWSKLRASKNQMSNSMLSSNSTRRRRYEYVQLLSVECQIYTYMYSNSIDQTSNSKKKQIRFVWIGRKTIRQILCYVFI